MNKKRVHSTASSSFLIIKDPTHSENTLLHLIKKPQANKRNPFQNIKSNHFGWFIKRGSRAILTELQGKGFFKKAIKFLEEDEKRLFQQGFFPRYKQGLLKEIQSKDSRHLTEINSITQPTHIDFTQIPSIAAQLVHFGYLPSKKTIEILKKEYKIKNFNKERLIQALNSLQTNELVNSNNCLKSGSLLVFLKKSSN